LESLLAAAAAEEQEKDEELRRLPLQAACCLDCYKVLLTGDTDYRLQITKYSNP
jgi:hypothetical protein